MEHCSASWGSDSARLTFLFTDIQGSTRLWEQRPREMADAHRRHTDIIAGAVEQFDGRLVRDRGEGDSTFSVFARAANGIAAACALQRALTSERWPEGVAIRVRAALHAGFAIYHWGDYNSTDVNRCARIRSLCHPGQTLLSQAVADESGSHLPDGVSLHFLGQHRLKDLQRPEPLYEILHPDLPAGFPPLRSLDTLPHNLPLLLTSFIGRERELRDVRELLGRCRLLTLTGTGGAGKTRLSLQVATDALEDYHDGVWVAELAPLADSALVVHAVASALGLRQEGPGPVEQRLIEYLRDRRLLLLLDNCEHVIEACARLTEHLLRACPGVTVLATSREPLGIYGEQSYHVPALVQPDPRPAGLPEIACCDSVRLFVERSRLHRPAFDLTEQNAGAVAEICRRLDGIPLALELAAARMKTLTPPQIADRLDDRFRLLTTGSRTSLPRQQTLRALIDWSYSLLSEQERVLLARLGVFAGGWTLEAAEEVCAEGPIERWQALDLLASLVEKSLVTYQEEGQVPRYRLLETIRQYALDRLKEMEEETATRSRHAAFFLQFSESCVSEWRSGHQQEILARLDADYDNIRHAVDWLLAAPDTVPLALRIVTALARYHETCGRASEAVERLNRGLADDHLADSVRASAARCLGQHLVYLNDFAGARPWLQLALDLHSRLNEPRGLAVSLNCFAMLHWRLGDYETAEQYSRGALALYENLGDSTATANQTMNLGLVAQSLGRFEEARASYKRALELRRADGDPESIALACNNIGSLAYDLGDLSEAREYLERALDNFEAIHHVTGTALVHRGLAAVELESGNTVAARRHLEQGRKGFASAGVEGGVARATLAMIGVDIAERDFDGARGRFPSAMETLRRLKLQPVLAEGLFIGCTLASACGQPTLAARLAGAFVAYRAALKSPLTPMEQRKLDDLRATLRRIHDAGEVAQAFSEGERLTAEQAVEEALTGFADVTPVQSESGV